MSTILRCDRCEMEKEYTFDELENEQREEQGIVFNHQRIGDNHHLLCGDCLEKHDHIVRAINEKHQAEKQKSLELWLNNKYD